jgi:hypothetical protein
MKGQTRHLTKVRNYVRKKFYDTGLGDILKGLESEEERGWSWHKADAEG